MIKRFEKIKNIGSFQYFSWNEINPPQVLNKNNQLVPHDTNFKKFNILFGENGTGKSTIVRILKALHLADVNIEKNWDRESEDREIKIITDNGSTNITFSESGKWQNNTLKDYFIFFDRDFINTHIHSFPFKRESGHDKNTGKLILLLGDFNSYKEQLDKLANIHGELAKKGNLLRKKIDDQKKEIISNRSEKEVFDSLKNIQSLPENKKPRLEEIQKKKSDVEDSLKKLDRIISQSSDIQKIKILTKAEKNKVNDIQKIKDAFLFSVSTGAVAIIKEIENKEDFIQKGLNEIKNKKLDACPFCNQNIKENGKYIHIIEEYEKIFDIEFTRRQSDVEQILSSYKDNLLSLLREREPNLNRSYLENINKLLLRTDVLPNVSLSLIDADKIQGEIKCVDKKLKNILLKCDESKIEEIQKIAIEQNRKIDLYNTSIETINKEIEKNKKDLEDENTTKRRSVLLDEIEKESLNLFVLSHIQDLVNINESEKQYQNNLSNIAKIKSILDIFISKIKVKFGNFVKTYFGEIQKYVEIFCPSIEVEIFSPRVTYDLRSDEVVCGFEVRHKERDRFSHLSDGEKQSVALAYFLALIKNTSDKDKKIVVFDDPINSFDAGRRKMCAEYIFKELIAFEQGFIFTCDPLFRTYIRKITGRKFGSDRSEYYILKSASSSIHHRSDSEATIYAIFKGEFRNIDSIQGKDENIIIFGQKLRYCIEEVKDKYLGYSHDSLDNMLGQVMKSDFNKLKISMDELMEIYSFCNVGGLAHYPRDGQTSWDELKFQIKRYMRLGL